MEHINNYINEHKDRFINELIELLNSFHLADPAYKADVLNCAEAVLKQWKMQEQTILKYETAGYPIVYGEKSR